MGGTTAFRTHVIPGVAGKVLESPSRMINAIHSLTRTVSYESAIAGQAYRVAANEGRFGDDLARRINQLTTNPTEEMMGTAVNEANENALMQRAPYGSLTAAMSRITNAGFAVPDIPLPGGHSIPMGTLRPLKFIDPFVSISSNVINSAIVKRTPLGLLSPDMRADLSGANGTAAFDRAAGRMLAGTSFYLMAGGWPPRG